MQSSESTRSAYRISSLIPGCGQALPSATLGKETPCIGMWVLQVPHYLYPVNVEKHSGFTPTTPGRMGRTTALSSMS